MLSFCLVICNLGVGEHTPYTTAKRDYTKLQNYKITKNRQITKLQNYNSFKKIQLSGNSGQLKKIV